MIGGYKSSQLGPSLNTEVAFVTTTLRVKAISTTRFSHSTTTSSSLHVSPFLVTLHFTFLFHKTPIYTSKSAHVKIRNK